MGDALSVPFIVSCFLCITKCSSICVVDFSLAGNKNVPFSLYLFVSRSGSIIVNLEIHFKTPVTTNEGLSTLRNVVSDGSLGPFTVGTLKIITGVLPPSTTEATFTPADVPKGKTSTSLGELIISFQGLPRAKTEVAPFEVSRSIVLFT